MLVDCNCFYVSCERVFRPDLDKKPVVVLSNNDGCVIALSKEAKSLGVKMCDPWFKIKKNYISKGVIPFSSNYELYADLSYRIMNILESMAIDIEVYSIDEAFLDLKKIKNSKDLKKIAIQCQAMIKKNIGIPVRVGVGPTKTLAKIASYGAKHYEELEGVLILSKKQDQHKLMHDMPIQEVWGVGLQLSKYLHSLGIKNAFDLLKTDIISMRKILGINLEKIIMELNGKECIGLKKIVKEKKKIIVSRTFSQKITKLNFLQEAISDYTARAAEKLRREGQLCKSLTVFIQTNIFTELDRQYRNRFLVSFSFPTDDTRELIIAAKSSIKKIHRSEYSYSKVGVILSDLSQNKIFQIDMLNEKDIKRAKSLMSVIDEINLYHKKSVTFMAQGIKRDWSMKRHYQSPKYTTNWDDLPQVI
tara:strand:+ start:443 stop:1696 length:1254 start_codon:yes stop_codon:yes gene_type:complete